MRCSAFVTLGTTSGLTQRPEKPDVLNPEDTEPKDLKRFFSAIEARFKSSTTENLTLVQTFKPTSTDTPKRMFARFNVLCKPLEDERPCLLTREQMKTTYVYNLKLLLTAEESENLDRDIKHRERKRAQYGKNVLTRYEIHDMILLQQRKSVMEMTKLRAVGLMQGADKQAAMHRLPKEKDEGAANNNPPPPKKQEREETKSCNICPLRGHIAKYCPDRKMEARVPTPHAAKKPLHKRLGPGKDLILPSGGKGKPVNPKNPH